jgi:uncharacterized membrane protein
MPRNPASYVFPAFGFIVAAVLLVSAFYFPNWRMTWGRRGTVPMSVRGKKAMGIYFAYFGLVGFLGSNRTIWGMWLVGLAVLMAVMYSISSRDRRDHENSISDK